MGFQLIRLILPVVVLALAFSAFAAEMDSTGESPDWVQLFLGLFGGLALFLGGLQLLSEGMTKAAGQTMKTELAKLTTNRQQFLMEILRKGIQEKQLQQLIIM